MGLRTDLDGIRCSMSRRGNCWVNALMERFFLNLKMERVWQAIEQVLSCHTRYQSSQTMLVPRSFAILPAGIARSLNVPSTG
jgi:transposase InsO family protein